MREMRLTVMEIDGLSCMSHDGESFYLFPISIFHSLSLSLSGENKSFDTDESFVFQPKKILSSSHENTEHWMKSFAVFDDETWRLWTSLNVFVFVCTVVMALACKKFLLKLVIFCEYEITRQNKTFNEAKATVTQTFIGMMLRLGPRSKERKVKHEVNFQTLMSKAIHFTLHLNFICCARLRIFFRKAFAMNMNISANFEIAGQISTFN